MGKQKINICFTCGEMASTTEHHVKELENEVTIEMCQKCHVTLNHYQEEALPKLKKFLDENDV